jgi:hypothetical protein
MIKVVHSILPLKLLFIDQIKNFLNKKDQLKKL